MIIGSVPISILGYLLKDEIRTSARNLWITATMLVVFGLLLGLADHLAKQQRDELRMKDAIGMGLAQALALIPGVSRSGGTLTAGLFLGLTRRRRRGIRSCWRFRRCSVRGCSPFRMCWSVRVRVCRRRFRR